LNKPLIFNLILGLTGGLQLALVIATAIFVSGVEILEEIPLPHEKEDDKMICAQVRGTRLGLGALQRGY
jgi:hypothetical protein